MTAPIKLCLRLRLLSLHVFVDEDDVDTVVATSARDAMRVWCAHTGGERDDAGEFYRIDDGKILSIRNEESDPPVKKTAAEWAQSNGRGFLCSTEY